MGTIQRIERQHGGLKRVVIERGPRWVFALWRAGTHRCSARTARGGRCRRHVNLQAGVSPYCARHRGDSPVYFLQSAQYDAAFPCGCGYSVAHVLMDAHRIAGRPRKQPQIPAIAPPAQEHASRESA